MSHTVIYKLSICILVIIGLSSITPAQTSTSPKYLPDSLLAAAREVMDMQKYCALVTLDSLNRPNVRTINPFPPEADMTVWMATSSRTRKAADIQRNPTVSLYYADHASARGYVTIKGKAYLVDDQKEIQERKRAYWTSSFPDWSLLRLIKVVPDEIEVVNYRRGVVGDSLTWKAPTVLFPKR
jgi:general stress protein 26